MSDEIENVNITDEEKEKLRKNSINTPESSRPFLDMILSALECSENDYLALLSLCLLYALCNNKGEYFFGVLIFLLDFNTFFMFCMQFNVEF